MDSIVNYMEKIKKAHTEMSVLMDYPPFVGDLERKFRNEFQNEYSLLADRVEKHSEDGNYGAVVLEEPFAELAKKYKDELEEAKLYLKRYGNTADGSLEAHEAYKKS